MCSFNFCVERFSLSAPSGKSWKMCFCLLVCCLVATVACGQASETVVDRALRLENQGALERSLATFSEAVRMAPGNAGLLARRGGVHFKLGDNASALRDFDRAIVLDPDLTPYLWQRGLSLYYAKRWDDCEAQFVSHRTVNPNDVENAAWHFLCVARRDGVAAARKAILPVGTDSRVPMAAVYELYSGRGSEEGVLDAARKSKVGALEDRLFYGHLYLGLWAEVDGRPKDAQEHIEKAVTFNFPHYMGDMARVHLKWIVDGSQPGDSLVDE